MAEAASRPRRREMQARAFRIINVPMRAVLGLPFATPLSGSRIRLRGRHVEATPEVVAGVDEVDKLLAVMVAANPRAAAFIGISRGPDGRFDRAGLEAAVRYGFRIVRWHVRRSQARGAGQSPSGGAQMPATNSRLAVRPLSGYIGKEVRGQGVASGSQSVKLGHAEGPGLARPAPRAGET